MPGRPMTPQERIVYQAWAQRNLVEPFLESMEKSHQQATRDSGPPDTSPRRLRFRAARGSPAAKSASPPSRTWGWGPWGRRSQGRRPSSRPEIPWPKSRLVLSSSPLVGCLACVGPRPSLPGRFGAPSGCTTSCSTGPSTAALRASPCSPASPGMPPHPRSSNASPGSDHSPPRTLSGLLRAVRSWRAIGAGAQGEGVAELLAMGPVAGAFHRSLRDISFRTVDETQALVARGHATAHLPERFPPCLAIGWPA